ncbi:hypothetical protein HRED_10607, partial [Candidatus Haloredivivus sp. G17]
MVSFLYFFNYIIADFSIVSTVAVFAFVVYLQAMRVEIPLTFGNVRG